MVEMMTPGEAAATLGQAAHVGDWQSDGGLARIRAAASLLGPPADDVVRAAVDEIRRLRAPVPMILYCPMCRARHIDRGEFERKPHHTHACQGCGFAWRPAIVATVGVDFLPGFKDPDPGYVVGVDMAAGDETRAVALARRALAEGPCAFVLRREVEGYKSSVTFCGEPAYGSLDGVAPLCPKHGGPPPPQRILAASPCEFILRTETTEGGRTRGLRCGEPAFGGSDTEGNRCPQHGGPPAPPGATP